MSVEVKASFCIVSFLLSLTTLIPGIIVLVNNQYILGAFLIIIGLFTLLPPIIIYFRQKEGARPRDLSDEILVMEEGQLRTLSQEEYTRRFEERRRIANQRRLERSYQSRAEIMTPNGTIIDSMQVLVYKGDVEDRFCMICKLELRINQEILECPLCGSLYHKEHLMKWIRINKKCPVCRGLLKPAS